MKKFMFTAIAMIAFMGSSMANTIELEKSRFEIESCEMEAPEKTNPVDCLANKFLIYVDMTANECQDHALATSVANQYYFWCMLDAV